MAGGTNYYIQALVFGNHLLGEDGQEDEPDSATTSTKTQTKAKAKKTSLPSKEETALLCQRLWEVDPVMANFLHPNDHRKIQRSLEVFEQTGRLQSDLLREKQAGGPELRYRTCFLWVATDTEVLDARLDARVDQMVSQELFRELGEMRAISKETTPENTQGIFQALGYKEFEDYLSAVEGGEGEKECEELRAEGLEQMKSGTRRYARRQVQWIKTHFVSQLDKDRELGESCLYVLNTTSKILFFLVVPLRILSGVPFPRSEGVEGRGL